MLFIVSEKKIVPFLNVPLNCQKISIFLKELRTFPSYTFRSKELVLQKRDKKKQRLCHQAQLLSNSCPSENESNYRCVSGVTEVKKKKKKKVYKTNHYKRVLQVGDSSYIHTPESYRGIAQWMIFFRRAEVRHAGGFTTQLLNSSRLIFSLFSAGLCLFTREAEVGRGILREPEIWFLIVPRIPTATVYSLLEVEFWNTSPSNRTGLIRSVKSGARRLG